MTEAGGRVRVFLDSGVVIEGCISPWGAAKAVLILLTSRERYLVQLSELGRLEISRVAERHPGLSPEAGTSMRAAVDGWLDRVELQTLPVPREEDVAARERELLPFVRHSNDLPLVVAAIRAQPDWVISSNRRHWTSELSAYTGLRIASPWEFLRALSPG